MIFGAALCIFDGMHSTLPPIDLLAATRLPRLNEWTAAQLAESACVSEESAEAVCRAMAHAQRGRGKTAAGRGRRS